MCGDSFEQTDEMAEALLSDTLGVSMRADDIDGAEESYLDWKMLSVCAMAHDLGFKPEDAACEQWSALGAECAAHVSDEEAATYLRLTH